MENGVIKNHKFKVATSSGNSGCYTGGASMENRRGCFVARLLMVAGPERLSS